MKKLLNGILVAVLLLCMAVSIILSACSLDGLNRKRAEGKKEINAYAATKIETDYREEEWAKLQDIVIEGNYRIKSALTQQDISLIICETKIKVNGITPRIVDQISDGYFSLAADSWELCVREFANINKKSEAWIQETIDNNGEGVIENDFRPRSDYYSVIIGNQITISYDRDFSYSLSQGSHGFYMGKIAQREIELHELSNDLYVKQSTGWILHFQRDSSYNILNDTVIEKVLEPPGEISHYVDTDRLVLSWNYHSEYGSMGAVSEIKRLEDEQFEVYRYEVVYMNMYVMEFELSKFIKGDNYVRIYHRGGPSVTKDKECVLFIDSDYITYLVHVGNEITVEQI